MKTQKINLVVIIGLFSLSSLPAKGVPFSFNTRVRRHPKFTQEEEIKRTMEALCRCCKARQQGAPEQDVIDRARELVNADQEYQSNSSWFKTILFKYPRMRDAGIAGLSFVGGLATYWLFIDT